MSINRQIAGIVRRNPSLMLIAYHLYRFIQPKYSVGVVGVVINDLEQVLLVEHVFHPKVPWGLPGGWIGRNENPEKTIAREIREELDMTIEVDKVLLTRRTQYNHIDIAYLCSPKSDIGEISYELLDYKWHRLEELPRVHSFHYQAIDKAYAELRQQD